MSVPQMVSRLGLWPCPRSLRSTPCAKISLAVSPSCEAHSRGAPWVFSRRPITQLEPSRTHVHLSLPGTHGACPRVPAPAGSLGSTSRSSLLRVTVPIETLVTCGVFGHVELCRWWNAHNRAARESFRHTRSRHQPHAPRVLRIRRKSLDSCCPVTSDGVQPPLPGLKVNMRG